MSGNLCIQDSLVVLPYLPVLLILHLVSGAYTRKAERICRFPPMRFNWQNVALDGATKVAGRQYGANYRICLSRLWPGLTLAWVPLALPRTSRGTRESCQSRGSSHELHLAGQM
jgi:hypothetical protein